MVVQDVRVVQAVSANTYTHRVRERGAGEREMEREGIYNLKTRHELTTLLNAQHKLQ